MSDPISVAGTAVGVLSLGIQVFQGLLEYYRAWQGQSEEIKSTLESIACEQLILELLQSTLAEQPSGFTASVVPVEECITQAGAEFRKLEQILQKCRRSCVQGNVQEHLKNVMKNFLYPFRRETIQDLKNVVAEVGRVLALALQHLQLWAISNGQSSRDLLTIFSELTTDQRRSLLTLLDTISDQKNDLGSIQATTSGIGYHVRVLDQKLAEVQAANANIETCTTTMQSEIIEVRSKLDEINTNTQTSNLMLNTIKRSTEEYGQQMNLIRLALISKPSLLKEVCDDSKVYPIVNPPQLQDTRLSGPLKDQASVKIRSQNSPCTCHMRKSKSFRTLFSGVSTAIFRSTETNEYHRIHCPFYLASANTRKDTLRVRLGWSSLLLASTLELSFSLIRGAGGMTVGHLLVFRPIVCMSSPAFLIFEKHTMISRGALKNGRPTPYFNSYINSAIFELLQLFKSQQASPYETTERGTSLLWVSP